MSRDFRNIFLEIKISCVRFKYDCLLKFEGHSGTIPSLNGCLSFTSNFSCEFFFLCWDLVSRFYESLSYNWSIFLYYICANPNTDQVATFIVHWKSLPVIPIMFSFAYSSPSMKDIGWVAVLNIIRNFHTTESMKSVFLTLKCIYKSLIFLPILQCLWELKIVFFRKSTKRMTKWRLLQDINVSSFHFHALDLFLLCQRK